MHRDDKFHDPDNPYASPLSSIGEPDAVTGDDYESGELRPFTTIWTRPRVTIRGIVARDPQLHVVLLVCLAGLEQALDRASTRNSGDQIPMVAIIAIACVFGPLGGLLKLWLGSHLIRLSGSWIGGSGTREHIKTAMAWASVPVVFVLPLWIPTILLLGSEAFTAETPRLDSQPTIYMSFIAIVIAKGILSLWSLVLLCNTIAEVQGFRSAWRGLGNIILAGVVLMFPFVVLLLLLFALG